MRKSLLDLYDKGLERLEQANWTTKEAIFSLLAIDDKAELERVISLPDKEFKAELTK